MEPKERVPHDNLQKKNEVPEKEKKGKFRAGLKKVGFNIWLAVMIIGGTLAFITALFLL